MRPIELRFFGTEPLLERVTAERPQLQPCARSVAEELRSLRKELRVCDLGILERMDAKSRVLLRVQSVCATESDSTATDMRNFMTDNLIEPDLARTSGCVQCPSDTGAISAVCV